MICVASYLGHEGGWARHARGLAGGLDRREPTVLRNWDDSVPGPIELLHRLRLRLSRHSVGISLGAVERTHGLGTRFRVAYSVAETSRIPRPIRLHLQRADMIWTPSTWGRELLLENGLRAERIRIVPEGVDATAFTPPPADRRRDPVFRFLCVGKWEERKGTAGLVRAFAAEFDPSEPVELIMHCGTTLPRRRDFRTEIERIVAGRAGRRPRVVASKPCSFADYVALLQRCHAFVLPTRAEAWGLPILEAMACQLPCIVTDYSGLRTYANEDNAFLIRVRAMERVDDPEFFRPEYDWGLWARPDWDHLRQIMRYVVDQPEAARRRARRARTDAEQWSWDRAADAAARHIAELRGAASV